MCSGAAAAVDIIIRPGIHSHGQSGIFIQKINRDRARLGGIAECNEWRRRIPFTKSAYIPCRNICDVRTTASLRHIHGDVARKSVPIIGGFIGHHVGAHGIEIAGAVGN